MTTPEQRLKRFHRQLLKGKKPAKTTDGENAGKKLTHKEREAMFNAVFDEPLRKGANVKSRDRRR